MKLTSTSFKDGDYLGKDHVLSTDYGFGCSPAVGTAIFLVGLAWQVVGYARYGR